MADKKGLLARLLPGLIGLCLLACACAPRLPVLEEDLSAERELTVVGVSQVGSESGFRVANTESMRSVFTEEAGYQLLFDDARQKQENQIAAIRKFIQQQVDYIVLMPLSETGWDSVLQEARDAGVPVILVDRMVDVADEDLYAAHVGSDFRWEGEQAAAWLEEHFRGQAGPVNILHIQGTPGSSAQLGRTAALEEAVERNSGWTLLAQLDGDFTQAKTYEVVSQWLDSLPPDQPIHAVYCENDSEAFGTIQAMEEHGRPCGGDGAVVVTFDATRKGLSYCLEGRIALNVECNPLLGPLTEQVIRLLEAGEQPEKHYYAQEQLFTAAQLSQALIEQRKY